MPKITTDGTFESDVLNSKVPVMVDFWAPWCAPCRSIDPILERIAEKGADKVAVFKLNVDENSLMPSRYGIMAVPTIVIFTKGRITREFVGLEREEVYQGALSIL